MTNTPNNTIESIFGPVISSYSRSQALEDGVLVDVSGLAAEAGFRWPVAMTAAAFAATVPVPKGCEGFQDEVGRLWDVVYLARLRARGGGGLYCVRVVTHPSGRHRNIWLNVVAGPGDNHEPVVTIMLRGED